MFDKAIEIAKYDLKKECGFRFDAHEFQVNTIVDCLRSFQSGQYDNVIIVSPTGSGKSILGMGLAHTLRKLGLRSTYITPTRQLQTQLVNDFGKNPAVRSAKGKSNYPCLMYTSQRGRVIDANQAPCSEPDAFINPFENMRTRPDLISNPPETDHADLDERTLAAAVEYYSYSDGQIQDLLSEFEGKDGEWQSRHQIKLCSELGICPYRAARTAGDEAPVVIMNTKAYLMWNIYAKEAPYFKPRHLTIFDECHTLEDNARDFYSLEMTDHGLSTLYHEVMGPKPGGGNWVDLSAFKGMDKLLRHLYTLNGTALIKNMRDLGYEGSFEAYATLAEEIGERSHQSRLIRYHKIFKQASDPRANFAIDVIPPDGKTRKSPTLQITPVDIPPIFKHVYGLYNVFMSATIADVDVFCQSACLDRKRTRVLEIPDMFPVEHRPIISIPLVEVTKKAIDAPGSDVYGTLASTIEEIAGRYPKQRVLVHTNSYVMGAEINSRLGMLTQLRSLCPRNGAENKSMIAQYSNKSDASPYILITPACREGYDFEGDLCRVQIFTRCPFPSLGDPVVVKKLKTPGGRKWFAAKVATALRQQYGRSTRNAKDFSITFFLDRRIIEFINKNPKLFPKEFHEAMLIGKRLDWGSVDVAALQLEVGGVKVTR